jgi:hypothetical protein
MNRGSVALIAALAGLLAMLGAIAQGSPGARQSKAQEKEINSRDLHWSPPNVDAPIPTLSSTPPCPLSEVLQQTGAHAEEMIGNLQNFTAQEKIRYEKIDSISIPLEGESGIFDYAATFASRARGLEVQEARAPIKGSHDFPASNMDTGVAALALIFHPSLQGGYEMACEGADQWNGQPVWVIHFVQRKDKPSRTVRFNTVHGAYPASLKGRAWISTDSFQVLHLETNLVKGIGMMSLLGNAISVDYAPVQFHSQNVQVWLPQSDETFYDFGSYRVIFQHAFTNFLVFSVQTKQVIEKPKQP